MPTSDRVVFGATVRLIEEESEGEKCYQIVGEDEADIKVGKISFVSPIARALIGKFIGDSVDVHTPGGLKTYEVVDVQYL